MPNWRRAVNQRRTLTDRRIETLAKSWRNGLAPPPRITVPDWADRYRRLAGESGSTQGRWHTSTVEVSRGPMLAVTEPGVHVITVMCATQLMKTALIENVFGFFAHLDPCPILIVQPKDDAAEQFSKERISPLIRATPALKDRVGTGRMRNAEETLTYKAFPGGFLALVGAGSPDNLARRPVRVTLFDEVDKYPVTREGDPIALGEERTATFGINWLSVRCCSPTVEDESRIEGSYLASDQRRASVECPHCAHRMFPTFFKHVSWDKDAEGEHLPDTAAIYCEACGAAWSEGNRLSSLKTIRWHQTRPFFCCGTRHSPLDDYDAAWRAGGGVDDLWDWWVGDRWAVYRAKCRICGTWKVSNHHAGFQAGKLYSPWQKDRPADQADKWLAAKGDEDLLKVWWNTQQGVVYRRRAGKEIDPSALMARREVYPAEVPGGVAVITIGADTQGDRVELEVVGWGRDEESWSIAYEVIEGDPERPEFWARVRDFITRRWLKADGTPFVAGAACFDSGGNHTQAVYQFCRANAGLLRGGVHAIKGGSERSGTRSPVWPPSRAAKRLRTDSFRPIIVGTNAAKDTISARLIISEPGPGFMHFPATWDKVRFDQLTAERLTMKRVGGHTYRVWQPRPDRTNEALDCRVYAYAALCSLFHRGLRLNAMADELKADRVSPVILAGTPEADRVAASLKSVPPKETPPPAVINAVRQTRSRYIYG